MDRSAPPSPRRLASAHVLLQKRESRRTSENNSSESADSPKGEQPLLSDGSPGSEGLIVADPPRIDRSVQTRTHDLITLQGCEAGFGEDVASSGDRGWRSPHGEPYRPLGNPKLSLKFTPQLQGDLIKSAKMANSVKAEGDERKPSPVTPRGLTSPLAPAMNVFDMFPRNLHKRPPEDRQLKLAMRLQESVANYSSDKTRGLRRPNPVTIMRVGNENAAAEVDEGEDLHVSILRLQDQHRHNIGEEHSSCPTMSPVRSPRFHVQHGESSFSLLQHAVQQGSARLQLVRNGQNFLDNIASSESMDFAELRRKYTLAREKFLVDQEARKKLGTSIRLPSSVAEDIEGEDDQNNHHSTISSHPHGGSEELHLYLPYTTREAKTSPHKPLPTLAEYKTRAREERLPMRGLVSSRASMATESSTSPPGSPRKPTSRQSRFGSRLIAGSPLGCTLGRPGVQSIAALSPSSPQKFSRTQSRRGSVILTTAMVEGGPAEQRSSLISARADPDSDALARAVASISQSPQSPRVHSVVHLQNAVDLVESVKDSQAQTLAKTLALLDHDRRDCLEAKYRNFHVHSGLESDMLQMREAAELDRVDCVSHNLNSYKWYPDLLKNLISNRDSHLLHPAELFCVDVIRRVASEGHAFKSEQLFRLVLMLHPDDVAVVEVQHVLTFLRRALAIPLSEWEPFFRMHSLPEPVEVFKQGEDSKLKEKKKQMRLAKLRSVVRINQVLRRLQTPVSQ